MMVTYVVDIISIMTSSVILSYVNAYSASTKSPSINNIIKITGFNCVQLSQANQLLTKHMPMLGLGSIVDFHNKVSALALYFTCLNENGYSRYDMLMMISIGAESLKGLSIESLRRWRVGEMSSSVTVGENPLCIPLRYTTYRADAQKCSQRWSQRTCFVKMRIVSPRDGFSCESLVDTRE